MKPIVAVLSFIIGAAAGAAVAVVVVRQKYIDLAEDEIQSVREMYESRVREAEDDEEATRAEFEEIQEKHRQRMAEEGEKKTRPYRTNYSDPIERLGPAEAAGAHIITRSDTKKAPYVISIDDFHNTKNYFDKINLTYYSGDGVLVDDKEELVDDIQNLVGDNLDKFGAQSEDPDVVFVRNEKMTSDFEITREKGSYAELVAGEIPEFKRGPNRAGDDNEESEE